MTHWAIIEWMRPRPELRAWAGTQLINTTWVWLGLMEGQRGLRFTTSTELN